MPPKQLQTVLNAEWGPGWQKRLARFDVRLFAAASIGQVHRAVTHNGHDLAINVQYPAVRASINSDVDNMVRLLRLPGLVLREFFVFGTMPTASNLTNYRYDRKTGRIVQLDFGAVQPVAPRLATQFRALAKVAPEGGHGATRAAMLRIRYFGPQTAPHHQDLLQSMFAVAMGSCAKTRRLTLAAGTCWNAYAIGMLHSASLR
ncbi:AarF/UbiB family protein [Pseudorhodobacter aquimaris]|uniref:AarF/UbiB family protein n=1 Tax=Pseudorhodobacter aquimaris TaxID=687412 RepID=UPI00067D80B0|nr:AarF/UbiB family protein [Pseudorhodobacter aquimaris]